MYAPQPCGCPGIEATSRREVSAAGENRLGVCGQQKVCSRPGRPEIASRPKTLKRPFSLATGKMPGAPIRPNPHHPYVHSSYLRGSSSRYYSADGKLRNQLRLGRPPKVALSTDVYQGRRIPGESGNSKPGAPPDGHILCPNRTPFPTEAYTAG